MTKSARHRIVAVGHSNRLYAALCALLFSSLLLAGSVAHAQLPPGAIDTTAQPQSTPQDPQRAQAAAALEKQDYPAALKLLTALVAKNPRDAHLLYDLAFTQDALDQTAEAAANYRRASAADATFFEPHLSLGLLLARNGQPKEAHADWPPQPRSTLPTLL